MDELTVCVTSTGGGVGEQILKALRRAARPYRIIGTDMQPNGTGFADCDAAAVLPPARDPAYLPRVLELCHQHHVAALLPGSEAELLTLSANRRHLEDQRIFFPASPHDLLELCLDKAALFDRLQARGLSAPWHARIRQRADLRDTVPYPLIFKPSKAAGGSADAYIVQDDEEAGLFCTYLLKTRGEFLAQEYVGTPEDEYTVGVLSDMAGQLMGSIALHRTLQPALSRRLSVPNRTGRKELGPFLVISSGVSQGDIAAFPEISVQCEHIATRLGACGPFNLQCRVVNGRVQLFEINPRFSGTTSLRAMAGFNEPDLLLRRHVLGQDVSGSFTIEPQTILRRLEEVRVNGTCSAIS